jgi:hypothetical protein
MHGAASSLSFHEVMGLTSDDEQGRRLGFASGRDNYGERSEPKNVFARGGLISPETAKLLN